MATKKKAAGMPGRVKSASGVKVAKGSGFTAFARTRKVGKGGGRTAYGKMSVVRGGGKVAVSGKGTHAYKNGSHEPSK